MSYGLITYAVKSSSCVKNDPSVPPHINYEPSLVVDSIFAVLPRTVLFTVVFMAT